jgi:hypothetical protein
MGVLRSSVQTAVYEAFEGPVAGGAGLAEALHHLQRDLEASTFLGGDGLPSLTDLTVFAR